MVIVINYNLVTRRKLRGNSIFAESRILDTTKVQFVFGLFHLHYLYLHYCYESMSTMSGK